MYEWIDLIKQNCSTVTDQECVSMTFDQRNNTQWQEYLLPFDPTPVHDGKNFFFLFFCWLHVIIEMQINFEQTKKRVLAPDVGDWVQNKPEPSKPLEKHANFYRIMAKNPEFLVSS